ARLTGILSDLCSFSVYDRIHNLFSVSRAVATETGSAGFGRLFPQSERSRLYLPAVALLHIATTTRSRSRHRTGLRPHSPKFGNISNCEQTGRSVGPQHATKFLLAGQRRRAVATLIGFGRDFGLYFADAGFFCGFGRL